MRVRIVFSLQNKGATAPFHHQDLLYGWLTRLLPEIYTDYQEMYSFSGLKGQIEVSQKGLHFSSHKVSLVFSSMNKTLINKLLEKIFQQEQLQIAELILRPEYVEKEIFPELSHKTQFLCISPIVLASPEKSSFYAKHFVSPSIELFSQLLYEATIERMKSCKFYTESDFNENISFKFVPDNAYLEKIKNQDKKFARIYGIQDYTQRYEIRGYTLPFTLEASPLIQNFVINCGIGAYGYRGYGMLDLVEHQQTQRITLTNWQMALSD